MEKSEENKYEIFHDDRYLQCEKALYGRHYRTSETDQEDDFPWELFCDQSPQTVSNIIRRIPTLSSIIQKRFDELAERKPADGKLIELMEDLTDLCAESEKPCILMIDEADAASDYQCFLDFLGQLRSGYLKRERYDNAKVFQSVILAGVTDIRYLKSRIRNDQEGKVNSPWNIAVPFNIDMSFNPNDIAGMLEEYENDHHTGMDIPFMSQRIYDYTSGYPFLVSRLCQIMDEEFPGLEDPWSHTGMDEAVKSILKERNALFASLDTKVRNRPVLADVLKRMLMKGEQFSYSQYQGNLTELEMYGFIKNSNSKVMVSNRIFETFLYNQFLSDEEINASPFYFQALGQKNIFTQEGFLNVPLILDHFAKAYEDIIGNVEKRFNEKDRRELFLLYLKPIINGTGNYYIEAETRDQTKTDVIVDYLGKQYVIELKIWRGKRYNEEGEKQIKDYLDYYRLDTGYMMSFNFNKKKTTGVERIIIGDITLFEAVV